MPASPSGPLHIIGTLRINDHCVFEWEEPARGGARTIYVRADHCQPCLEALPLHCPTPLYVLKWRVEDERGAR